MKKKMSNNGITLIKSFEGCRLKAYRCPAGVLTIGYGHTGNDVKENTIWTQFQAEVALLTDLTKYEKYVNDMETEFDYCFNQNEFDALVSFTYNCGKGNLYKLTQNGTRNSEQIAKAMPLYNKANGNVLQGLVNRRKAEVELFTSGTMVRGDDVYIDTTSNVLKIENILFRFKQNYNIREIPSTSGKVVNSTTKHDLMEIKGLSKDKQWLLTEYGWVNIQGLYDIIK